jgi:hypothetical protein
VGLLRLLRSNHSECPASWVAAEGDLPAHSIAAR